MSREDAQFKLRLPNSVKKQIEIAANEKRRSMNAEILARLEQSFAPAAVPGILPAPPKPAKQCSLTDGQMAKSLRDKLLRVIDDAIAETTPIPDESATEERYKAATESTTRHPSRSVIFDTQIGGRNVQLEIRKKRTFVKHNTKDE